MKDNNFNNSKITLEKSFQKLEKVDFSKFSAVDRKEFKEELDEITDLILFAKDAIKQETG